MATGDRKDPVLGFHFAVEISGLFVAGFNEVSGLQAEIEIQEYREGPSNLILKKGVTDSTVLWSWYRDVMSGTVQRRPVDVVLMSSSGEEKRRWKLQNAYPVKWTGPDLKATASEVAVETLELAHEGLTPQ